MKLSVVIPVYGCPAAVVPFHERLVSSIATITNDYEIIMVNDACPKGSWDEIVKVCAKDTRVIGIDLSRNFGQIRAITAGLDVCTGDWVVVMDCDLQDRPEVIPDLYKKALEGYDVVFARRTERKDSAVVKFLSRAFYKVYDYFTDGRYDASLCNFSISRREVIQAYCAMREQNRAYTLFLKWVGYKQTAVDVDTDARYEGKSSYNFKRKMNMAIQLITAQSNKPLMFLVKIGFVISAFSFLFILWKVIKYFITGNVLSGWTSMIVSMYFLGGLIMIFMGVLGIYIGYIFNEVKQRPLYFVRSMINKDPQRNMPKPNKNCERDCCGTDVEKNTEDSRK